MLRKSEYLIILQILITYVNRGTAKILYSTYCFNSINVVTMFSHIPKTYCNTNEFEYLKHNNL